MPSSIRVNLMFRSAPSLQLAPVVKPVCSPHLQMSGRESTDTKPKFEEYYRLSCSTGYDKNFKVLVICITNSFKVSYNSWITATFGVNGLMYVLQLTLLSLLSEQTLEFNRKTFPLNSSIIYLLKELQSIQTNLTFAMDYCSRSSLNYNSPIFGTTDVTARELGILYNGVFHNLDTQ